MNFWNMHNPKERFYSGKTRQLHAAHLGVYDRLWSSLPHLRPMATVVADSVNYGIDQDGAGVHDVIGELGASRARAAATAGPMLGGHSSLSPKTHGPWPKHRRFLMQLNRS